VLSSFSADERIDSLTKKFPHPSRVAD
jgi:hypothetical protein